MKVYILTKAAIVALFAVFGKAYNKHICFSAAAVASGTARVWVLLQLQKPFMR